MTSVVRRMPAEAAVETSPTATVVTDHASRTNCGRSGPAEGWGWQSGRFRGIIRNHAGSLFNPETGEMTAVGEEWRGWVAGR